MPPFGSLVHREEPIGYGKLAFCLPPLKKFSCFIILKLVFPCGSSMCIEIRLSCPLVSHKPAMLKKEKISICFLFYEIIIKFPIIYSFKNNTYVFKFMFRARDRVKEREG